MPIRPLTITLLVILLTAMPGLAQESGTASGTLVAGANKLTLRHASVVAEAGDGGKDQYRVLITDQPLSASAAKDEFVRGLLFLERKVHGLELVLDAAKNIVSTKLYHPDLSGSGVAVSGFSVFTATAFDAQKVAGTIAAEKPVDLVGTTASYNATFAAPVLRWRTITAADLESPPGKAATAFLKAAAAADAKAMRALLTPEAAKELDGPDGKEILKALPGLFRPSMKIIVLEVSGDSAVVIAGDAEQKVRFRMVRQGGQWKATLPEG